MWQLAYISSERGLIERKNRRTSGSRVVKLAMLMSLSFPYMKSFSIPEFP
jgi:hypothetical protein